MNYEMAAIGRMLYGLTHARHVMEKLDAGDFCDPRNTLIYYAVKQVAERGDQPDLITVRQQLEDNGTLRAAGGAAHLASCVDEEGDVSFLKCVEKMKGKESRA